MTPYTAIFLSSLAALMFVVAIHTALELKLDGIDEGGNVEGHVASREQRGSIVYRRQRPLSTVWPRSERRPVAPARNPKPGPKPAAGIKPGTPSSMSSVLGAATARYGGAR